ncbi:MAG: pilus assembly protein N-terminal domain-containing protein [Sulfurisoma sp.]|nr:pilus assembly protein N-terminal domain-containing protein [Sulfurisoma sp.]
MRTILLALSIFCLTAGRSGAEQFRWNPYYSPPPAYRSATEDQETAALRQINFRRGQIGLAPVTSHADMARAARAHSSYLAANNTTGHYETPSAQGYFGDTPGTRLSNSGYPYRTYGEIISFGPATGTLGIESLIEAIYHRFAIFTSSFDEAGAGFNTDHPTHGNVLTVDFGSRSSPLPAARADWVGLYPFDGQDRVPVDFYSDQESPDPMPDANRVGYPVSIHIDSASTLQVTSFTLFDGATALPTSLLSPGAQSVPASASAMIPNQVLEHGRTYTASFVGSVDGARLERQWTFATSPPSNIGFSVSPLCVTTGNSRVVSITGGTGSYVRVGWDNSSVVDVSFASSGQLSIRGLSAGTAVVTVTDGDGQQGQLTASVGATCMATGLDADRVFNWAESLFPAILEPQGRASQDSGGVYLRHYFTTGNYLGAYNGQLYFLDGYSGQLLHLGSIGDFLAATAAAGF